MPVTLLTWFSVTIFKGLHIIHDDHSEPILVLTQFLAQLFLVQFSLVIHANLDVITISLSPGKEIAVVLVRSHKYDGTLWVIGNGFYDATHRTTHIRLPGARITVRMRALVETQISRLVKTERAAREGTLQWLLVTVQFQCQPDLPC